MGLKYTVKTKRKMLRTIGIRPKKRKPTIRKLSRIKRTEVLISLITIQFRLSFEGHKSLEHPSLESTSTISYADSNGGILVLVEVGVRGGGAEHLPPSHQVVGKTWIWTVRKKIK